MLVPERFVWEDEHFEMPCSAHDDISRLPVMELQAWSAVDELNMSWAFSHAVDFSLHSYLIRINSNLFLFVARLDLLL